MSSPQAARSTSDSIEQFLFSRIAEAQNALWRAELVRRVLGLVIAALAGLLLWWIVDQWIWAPGVIGRSLLVAMVGLAVVAYGVIGLWPVVNLRVRPDYAARCLERDHPELGHSLSSYIGLLSDSEGHSDSKGHSSKGHSSKGHSSKGHSASSKDRPSAPLGAANRPLGLSDRVVQSIGAEAARKLRTIDEPPSEATGLLPWWATTIGLIAVLAIYSAASPKSILQSTARIFQPLADLGAPQRVQISDVVPGSAEVLAGRTFQVSALVKNLREQEPVVFVWGDSQNQTDSPSTKVSSGAPSGAPSDAQSSTARVDPSNQIILPPMTGGQPGQFAAEIVVPHHASGVKRYRIQAGDASAGPFELSIRDTPVVRVANVHYEPPAYTGQKPRTRRTGDISGVEGTRVRIVADVNRPITRAILELNPKLIGQEVRATAGASEMKVIDGGSRAEHEMVLQSRGGNGTIELENYRIRVWDDAEQTNADPIVYPIEVIEDLPPEIKIVVPQRSPVDVPFDSVQRFEIHASDVDFGLSTVEIEVRRGIDLIARSTVWNADEMDVPADASGRAQRVGAKQVLGNQVLGNQVLGNQVLGNQVIEYRFRPSRMITLGRGGRLNVGDTVEVVAIATDNRTALHGGQGRLGGGVAGGGLLRPGQKQDAGVTRTSPVLLNITMPQDPGQKSDEPEKKKRDRNQDAQQGGEGESGQGQQGEQGSGSGSQSEKAEQGKGQGENGQGQSGQGQQGEGQEGEGQEGEGQEGEGQSSGNQQGQSQGGQGDSNEPMESNEPNDGNEPDGSNEDRSAGADSNGGERGSQSDSPQQGDQPMQNQQSGGQDSGGQESSGQESGKQESGKQDAGQQQGNQQGEQSGQSGNSEQGQRDEDSGAGDGQSNDSGDSPNGDSQRPPQDDAEAFERIKEYLENQEKNNEKNQSNGSGDQQQGDGSKGDREQEAGQQGDGELGDGEQGDGNKGEGEKSEQSGEAGKRDMESQGEAADDGQSGDPSGDQSGGDQSSGDQANSEQRPGGEQNDAQEGGSSQDQSQEEGGQTSDGKSQPDGSPMDNAQANDDSSEGQNSDDAQGQGQGQGQEQASDGDQSKSSPDSGKQDSSQQESGKQEPGKPGQSGEQQDGSSSSSQDGKPDSDASSADSSQPGPQGDGRTDADASSPADPMDSQGGSTGSSGAGSGEEGQGEEGELPDPVDMEYTKKATDMVLDYLDETRQDPDPELLDRLKWSEQDLKKFRNRWQDVRQPDQESSSPSEMNNELREALQSLGMRPSNSTQGNQRDQADGLRGLRDSGNRREAPPSVRDAFEAFRRGLSR